MRVFFERRTLHRTLGTHRNRALDTTGTRVSLSARRGRATLEATSAPEIAIWVHPLNYAQIPHRRLLYRDPLPICHGTRSHLIPATSISAPTSNSPSFAWWREPPAKAGTSSRLAESQSNPYQRTHVLWPIKGISADFKTCVSTTIHVRCGSDERRLPIRLAFIMKSGLQRL